MSEVKLYLGDCLEIMPTLDDNSVDAVITDPPYGKEFNWIYGELARVSNKVLKPGCLLISMCGHHSIDKILHDMTKYMDFYWLGGKPNSTGSIARYHPKQLMVSWKPIIWLSKGKANKHDYVFDNFQSRRVERINHKWEQDVSWFTYYINKLTDKGDTILDPMMGSGTTALACLLTDRNFIGIEIEPKYFEVAEKRIKEAQMQLRMPF